jgi:hypothetical protein
MMTMTLSTGRNIKAAGDPLQPMSIDELYETLVHPQESLAAQIRQLQTVRFLDEKLFKEAKKTLPYLVCGSFNPNYRKIENFAYTDCFVLDLDNLMENGFTVEGIKQLIKADERVALAFVSPGGNGLKVMFRLKERCYDSGVYSLFYKKFAMDFAVQHGLLSVVDTRTSDVARACFLSVDPGAYRNNEAIAVDMNAIIDTENLDALFSIKQEIKEEVKSAAQGAKGEDALKDSKDPDAEILSLIRAKLSANERVERPRQPVYVPEELEQAIDGIRQAIEDIGIEMKDVKDIQYGKKLVMRSSLRTAEVNVFFGHRGFSVVESPRRGTSPELNNLMCRIIKQHLDTIYT